MLDTCAILWLAADSTLLSQVAREAISKHRSRLFVSAISAFEIGVKHRKGRLDLGMEPETWWERALVHHGLQVVSVTDAIALAATALPRLHADPCDRMIVATAHTITASVVTSDALIRQYPDVTVLW